VDGDLPGLGTTTYAYDPINRAQTVTYASNATRTESYGIDGRLASVTGSAVVPEYYTYSVQSDTGYRVTRTGFGTNPVVRYVEVWTDQMGRTVRESRPGFTGQALARGDLHVRSCERSIVDPWADWVRANPLPI
jgi:hypothetical protein